jgi:hypothetical protein
MEDKTLLFKPTKMTLLQQAQNYPLTMPCVEFKNTKVICQVARDILTPASNHDENKPQLQEQSSF